MYVHCYSLNEDKIKAQFLIFSGPPFILTAKTEVGPAVRRVGNFSEVVFGRECNSRTKVLAGTRTHDRTHLRKLLPTLLTATPRDRCSLGNEI